MPRCRGRRRAFQLRPSPLRFERRADRGESGEASVVEQQETVRVRVALSAASPIPKADSTPERG